METKTNHAPLKNKEKHLLAISLFFYTILTILSLNLPFFSDGIVQSSQAAQWFYEHYFQAFFLPESQNPGHPPFWGMYLATWWKILGQKLWVSHLAMLPFLMGIAWQYFYIARYFVQGYQLVFAMIFLLIEPTLLALSTQVTPDIALLFFFLLALRGLLYQKNGLLILGLCAMPLLNTRGIMLVAVIGLMHMAVIFFTEKRKWNRSFILVYIPVFLVIFAWLLTHYLHSGWIGFNREEMPWQASFEKVGIVGFIKNWAILGWRFLDFGRVALWLVALIIVVRIIRKELTVTSTFWLLICLAFIQVLVFGPVITRYVGTLQHRYLLPSFLLFGIGLVYSLQFMKNRYVAYTLFGLCFVSMLNGHFLIYPDKVSQGWEASLAHLPYFELNKKMTAYVFENNLNPNEIAVGTPQKYKLMDTELEPSNWKYLDHTEVDVHQYPYVIYSNISNDFDPIYDELHDSWILEKEIQGGGIVMRLFKNPQ